MGLIFYFYPFFFLSLYYMLTLNICVGVFSGNFEVRMLKLCPHVCFILDLILISVFLR